MEWANGLLSKMLDGLVDWIPQRLPEHLQTVNDPDGKDTAIVIMRLAVSMMMTLLMTRTLSS